MSRGTAIVGDSPVAQYLIMLPSDTEYRALQRCYQTLVAQLDYRSIGPRMVSGHVVDLSQHDRIRHEPSDYARNEAFLTVLMTKCSKDQFGVFLRTLESDETLRNVFDIIKAAIREVEAESVSAVAVEQAEPASDEVGGEREESNVAELVTGIRTGGGGGGGLSRRRMGGGANSEEPVQNTDAVSASRPTHQSSDPTHFNGWLIIGWLVIAVAVLAVGLLLLRGWKGTATPYGGDVHSHVDVAYDPAPTGPASLDSLPTMRQLRVHVIPHIAAEWETFADVLLDSASATAQLRANYHTVAERCAEMFRLWLRHANPRWIDLVQVLRNLGHVTLSARLQKMISQGEVE